MHFVHKGLFLGPGSLVNRHSVRVLLGFLLERRLLLKFVVDACRACMLLRCRKSCHPDECLLEQLVVYDLSKVLVTQVVVI